EDAEGTHQGCSDQVRTDHYAAKVVTLGEKSPEGPDEHVGQQARHRRGCHPRPRVGPVEDVDEEGNVVEPVACFRNGQTLEEPPEVAPADDRFECPPRRPRRPHGSLLDYSGKPGSRVLSLTPEVVLSPGAGLGETQDLRSSP